MARLADSRARREYADFKVEREIPRPRQFNWQPGDLLDLLYHRLRESMSLGLSLVIRMERY